MNKVILLGRAVRDPELNTTNSGLSVCRFSLAVDRPFKQGEEKQADFLNIVAWRSQADSCGKYLKKGMRCVVEGSIQNRSYTDKTGANRTATEIIADRITFVDKAESKPEPECQQPNPQVKDMFSGFQPVDDSDNLPF